MKFEAVAEIVDGIPMMTRDQARLMYDHIRSAEAHDILELGTAHGVSTTYMAAALDEIGDGRITTVDRPRPAWDPPVDELLARAGLAHLVDVVRTRHSSYNWFLKQKLEEQTDEHGNTEPLYDLCYVDGSHLWTVDGYAALLSERLLRPGGWLVLDDLDWSVAFAGMSDPSLSQEELETAHMQAVFDLVIKPMPAFTELKRFADLDWGWARKAPGEQRRYALETSRPLGAVAVSRARAAIRAIRARRT